MRRMRQKKKSKCVEQLRRNVPSNQNKINFRIQSQPAHRVLKLKERKGEKKRAFAIDDQLSWKWSVRRSEESIIYSWSHSLTLDAFERWRRWRNVWVRRKKRSTSILQSIGLGEWAKSMNCIGCLAGPVWCESSCASITICLVAATAADNTKTQPEQQRSLWELLHTAADYKTIGWLIPPHCSSHGRRCLCTGAHCYFITWK